MKRKNVAIVWVQSSLHGNTNCSIFEEFFYIYSLINENNAPFGKNGVTIGFLAKEYIK